MNRADQLQLFQQANQEVVMIRQAELDYFINLFTVFGTNAALMGGFTFGILTQNIINYSSKGIKVYKFFYFVLAAITIASCVHVMLVCMLTRVYGPGLALNGPVGSMAKAVEGMRAEQKQIATSVLVMVLSFAIGSMWLFFCVMNFFQAVVATVVFLIAMWFWYCYCERIYLRFYWKTQTNNWNDYSDRARSRVISDDDNPANFVAAPQDGNATTTAANGRFKKKKIKFSLKWAFGMTPRVEEEVVEDTDADGTASAYRNGLFNYIFRNPADMTAEEHRGSLSGASPAGPKKSGAIQESGKKGSALAEPAASASVAMEGYFTTRFRSDQQAILESRRWERRYFVLLRAGEFYLYKTRQEYRSRPKEPIYLRPLQLHDFYVRIDNADEIARADQDEDMLTMRASTLTPYSGGSDKGHSTVSSNVSQKVPLYRFQLTLIPRENLDEAVLDGRKARLRNHWLLRCDTEEELDIWVAAIKETCPSCMK